ncbi:MAG: PspC domain-containing protein [Bacteroidota bacterium]|nr:PspC domain-containing protein [Bacteroidota bacterium]
MKKVVTVHIAGEIFQMEEDGAMRIQRVLRKIEMGSANGPALVKDIEQRMAVLLKEKATSENLVTREQADEVLNTLGYAAYLEDDQARSSATSHHTGYKRLYRHPNEKMLGGVCGGFAAYVNTDPVLMRIIFVVLFFGFGTGLFLYLIMWIVIPLARTQEQLDQLTL